MSFVLDASVVACWAFPDEDHPVADVALERVHHEEAFVPALWWFEVRNVLITSERRGRIVETQTAAFLRELARLPVVVDRSPSESEVLELCRRRRLTVYDASYLELARRADLPLATLDADLRRAARAENVPLFGDEPA
jgi:predicted nucleic acid-binding protein